MSTKYSTMQPSLRASMDFWLTHPSALFWRICGKIYRVFYSEEPWMSRGAIQFCERELHAGMQGLEWGSGRSTIWFAQRLSKITSVEHNKDWHALVKEKLARKGLQNVDYKMIPLDHPAEEPTHAKYEKTPSYVSVANELPDASLDFIVIDGHYRQACVLAALPKLKVGGLLLIDNSNWMAIDQWGVPAAWPIVHRSMGFDSETTIWKKV